MNQYYYRIEDTKKQNNEEYLGNFIGVFGGILIVIIIDAMEL